MHHCERWPEEDPTVSAGHPVWRFRPVRISAALMAILVLGACDQPMAQQLPDPKTSGAVPDDDRDDVAQLQIAVDALATSGGGMLTLPAGRFDLSQPLYLRSNVFIVGTDGNTILSNTRFNSADQWPGTLIFAGNMTPASYHDNGEVGYAGQSVRMTGPRTFKLSRCVASAALPAAGTFVWLSTVAGSKGAGGFTRPVYGEVSVATAAGDCMVTTADEFTPPADAALELHWSDGSKSQPASYSNRTPNLPIHDAGLRGLQLASKNGQALVSSGCYKCRFDTLRILSSRRLVMLEGARHTAYDGISGAFRERGIEGAMYASDNIVTNVKAEVAPSSALTMRPAIRFGEQARNNTVRNVQLDLGNVYFGRADKIRFDESSANHLYNVRLLVSKDDGKPLAFFSRREPDVSALMREGALTNVTICVTSRTEEPCRAAK